MIRSVLHACFVDICRIHFNIQVESLIALIAEHLPSHIEEDDDEDEEGEADENNPEDTEESSSIKKEESKPKVIRI